MTNAQRSSIWPLFVLLVLALVPRLAVAPKQGHRGDEAANQQFSLDMLRYGFDFYRETDSCYPPVMLYLMGGASAIWSAFGGDLTPGGVPFRVLIKLLAILADLGILLVIYFALLRARSVRQQLLYGCLIALNPVLIYDGAIWGQLESLVVLPVIGAVIACQHKRPHLSLSLAALAILIKPHAAAAAPLLALACYQKSGLRRTVLAAVVAAIVFVLLVAPFQAGSPPSMLVTNMLGHKGAENVQYSSLNAFNIWGLGGFFESHYHKIAGLTYLTWGLILGGLSYLWAGFVQWRNREPEGLWASLTLAYLGMFLFMTMMHERYIFYPAILATVWLIVDIRVLWSWLILMVLGTLNMHYRIRIPNWGFLHQLQDSYIILYTGVALNMAAYALLSRRSALNFSVRAKKTVN